MKTVIVIPYGRKRYTELLIPQLLQYDFVDEIRLWMNTDVPEDVLWAQSIQGTDRITIEYLPKGELPSRDGSQLYKFFLNCVDKDTIYVRFDDDIILVDDCEAFRKFINFRKEHPEYFIVYANILNNAIITHIHQKNGTLPALLDGKEVGYECLDEYGWKDPRVAEELHKYVLKTGCNLKQFYMPNHVVNRYNRISINCISWFGRQFEKFGGRVHLHEEMDISVWKPLQMSKPVCIYGEFVCVHYAFHTQRNHLDNNTDILDQYRRVLKNANNKKKNDETDRCQYCSGIS